MEVLAVLHGRRAKTELRQSLEPQAELGVVGGAPGDVMRRAGADQRRFLERWRERERGIRVEEPCVQVGVSDHGRLAEARHGPRKEPEPQTVGIGPLLLGVDGRRLEARPTRACLGRAGPRSARGHSKNVISEPGVPGSSPKYRW